MSKFKLNGWQDYWTLLDKLISLLNADGKGACVAELQDAKLYVNGFTDGWFDFLKAFDKVISEHNFEMNAEQLELASFLAKFLRETLRIR